jgi:tetratricopeptide (TPR) repeat protein
MRLLMLLALLATVVHAINKSALEQARNRQDRAALERLASEAGVAAAAQPQNAAAQYDAALSQSLVAEVAAEMRDRNGARSAAETGMKAADRAIALDGKRAEYHRILGTLCGQAIPANVLAAMKYGRCALDSLNKAIELDPKSAAAYLGRGVGYSYLPSAFGGGVDPALADIDKALQLDPKSADAWLWRGIVLRKANRNSEAREALSKAVQMNPDRIWAKQQLEKTPAK